MKKNKNIDIDAELKKFGENLEPLKPVRFSFEVIDPVGIITERHIFEYMPAYYAGRAIITINGHYWMVTGNGKNIYRVGEEIPQK
jgi:hypothetical protein